MLFLTQTERRIYLINELLKESERYSGAQIPQGETEQKRLLRSLCNVRPPLPADEEFLRVQDEYLQEESREKGVTDWKSLAPVQPGLYLWQGDITTLRCGAIVNAANSALLGCFIPCHGCIDNAIHSAAGVRLRLECARLMDAQGGEEPTGRAKLTPAYNLPCEYVLHTVGPIVRGALPNRRDCAQLASCYRSCMELAAARGLKSVAFCCISTGEFRFPNQQAARIAVETVRAYRQEHENTPEVIFNVFKDTDLEIYRRLLAAD